MKKENLLQYLLIAIGIAGILFVLGVLVFYYRYFPGEVSDNHERWGTFGDFVGGTLNPILSFFSFIALLITIFLQNRELRISNYELSASREEFALSRKVAEEQSLHYTMQGRKADHQKVIDVIDIELSSLMKKQLPKALAANLPGPSVRPTAYMTETFESDFFDLVEFDNMPFQTLHKSIRSNSRDLNELNHRVNDIRQELLSISECLVSYKNEFGNSVYLLHYQKKYRKLARYFDRNKLADDNFTEIFNN